MPRPRNVLLIIVDCLRADHLGCYGYPKETSPSIDTFARTATTFDRFFASAVPTQPSFTTLYTGQFPITHGIVAHKGDRELADDAPWLPTLLRAAGMTTADFCCLPRYKHWFLRGFEFVVDSTTRYEDYGYSAEVLNARAIPWLRHHADEPFFMVIHYWDPHTPYLPPDQYRIFYDGDPSDPALPDTLAPLRSQYFSVMWEKWFKKLPPGLRDAEFLVSLYDGEVRHADDGVGELLTVLSDTGHDDDTMVILLSDHGELFYRHDVFCDHHGLYDGNIRCPFIVRLPGVTGPGRHIRSFAGHQDVAPTVLWAFELGVPEAMEGADLMPMLRGEDHPVRDAVVSEECTWQAKWSLRTDTHKLIVSRIPDLHGNPMRELYDLTSDPDELSNIADTQPGRADTMAEQLEGWIRDMMRKHGLAEDPLLAHGITLGKQWERWNAQRK